MKIRSKILLIIAVTIGIITFLNSVILRNLLVDYIEAEELRSIVQNFHRADSMLQKEKEGLESTILDWTQWDDTYRYMDGNFPEYEEINLQDITLEALKLNFMFFINKNGTPVFTGTLNLNESDSFQKELLGKLNKEQPILMQLESRKPVTGILMISGNPVILSVSPITDSEGVAAANGLMIIGRIINRSFVSYLEEVLHVSLAFSDIRQDSIMGLPKEAYQKLALDDGTIWVRKSENEIKSFSALADINGNMEICLAFSIGRQLYRHGMDALNYFGSNFFIALVIIMLVSLAGLERFVINPINKLHSFMRSVASKKDTSVRINLPGKDEIAELAAITNKTLEELDTSYSELKVAEERFRLIMDATSDGCFDLDLAHNRIYISPEWLKLMGYEACDRFDGIEHYILFVHPEDRETCRRAWSDCLSGKAETFKVEYRTLSRSGEWVWILVRAKLVERDAQGNPARIIGTISDINGQKKIEQENLYLSQTDVMTTLKNRRYIDNILSQEQKNGQDLIWIIMGDVNGLKIINDSFGHQEGDKLLKAVGEILKSSCSPDDIPARWGGDEFIVFIKNKDAGYVEKLMKKIKNECDNIEGFPIKISIALGSARTDGDNRDLDAILKLAEERMYRNKLLESRSVRSAIIASLEQSLHEKHIETEAHTRRIKDLCIQVGKSMGMTQEELDELALLGILHDIGKIAIPESVLLKPGKLTPEEWEIMKTHSEIGYRIAASTPELAHIAEEILSHHERFDGGGYPQGLKGKDIPKLSRLLSIVDSFDVMTHDRHYKKAMTIEQAARELRDCSGKQFDPDMVAFFLDLLERRALIIN